MAASAHINAIASSLAKYYRFNKYGLVLNFKGM